MHDRHGMRVQLATADLQGVLNAAKPSDKAPKPSAVEALRGAFTTIIDSFERHVTHDLVFICSQTNTN